jgi:hypothetical protein
LRALAFATADTVGYIIGAYAPAQGAPDIGKFILLLRRSPAGRGESSPTWTTGTADAE